jgi:hypothetical protein
MGVTISSWDSNTNEACWIALTLELRVYQHLQSEGKLNVSPRTKGRRKTRGKSHNFMTSISRRLLGDDMAAITARKKKPVAHSDTFPPKGVLFLLPPDDVLLSVSLPLPPKVVPQKDGNSGRFTTNCFSLKSPRLRRKRAR